MCMYVWLPYVCGCKIGDFFNSLLLLLHGCLICYTKACITCACYFCKMSVFLYVLYIIIIIMVQFFCSLSVCIETMYCIF